MSNEIIDGDAELGDDGVLQGWCWNAQKPNERPVVEVLIDDRIVSTSIASRFREDLRTRKIGDGYYGFMTTLSRTLAEAGVRFVVTARERGSGRCFWRHIRGTHALPGDFPKRLDALRERLSGIARSPAFPALGDTSLAAGLADELGGLGARLNETGIGTGNSSPLRRARRQLLRRIAPATLEAIPHPRAALVLVAGSTSEGALPAVAGLAPQIRELSVSLTLVDRGARSDTALAPSLFGNLNYVFDPHGDLRSLLTRTLSRSTADFLIFVRNPPATLGQGLAQLLPQMLGDGSLHLGSRCVSDACRALGQVLPPGIRRRTAGTPIGLQFAGRRRVLERFVGLPTPQGALASLEAVDLAIRTAQGDLDACIWDEPDGRHRPAGGSESTYAAGGDAA